MAICPYCNNNGGYPEGNNGGSLSITPGHLSVSTDLIVNYIRDLAREGKRDSRYCKALEIIGSSAENNPPQGEILMGAIKDAFYVPHDFPPEDIERKDISSLDITNLRRVGDFLFELGYIIPSLEIYKTVLYLSPSLKYNHIGKIIQTMERLSSDMNIEPWQRFDPNDLFGLGLVR